MFAAFWRRRYTASFLSGDLSSIHATSVNLQERPSVGNALPALRYIPPTAHAPAYISITRLPFA